jgi:bifunctional DNA-binding transcriptional regulator/antitoxin component of YhaV-PrlF toxin-antitoxin module
MDMCVVRMDTKFRVVIPKRIRSRAGIDKKANFFIYAFDNLLVFRKVVGDDIPPEVEKVRRAFGPCA